MRPGQRGEMLYDILRALSTQTSTGHIYVGQDGFEVRRSYAQLLKEASGLAASLSAAGFAKGERIALAISETQDFVKAFVACMLAGVVPVPIASPWLRQDLDIYCRSVDSILSAAEVSALIAPHALNERLLSVPAATHLHACLISLEALGSGGPGLPAGGDFKPSDPCFLQFTSGATGKPKGVVISYDNLSANLWAIMREGLHIDARDVVVSWLPMYHDMGLVGKFLATLAFALDTVYLPTLEFMKRPSIWMRAMSRYRGTISFAPNFAYMLAAKRLPGATSDLDLSHVRVLGCGAEPINPAVLRNFLDTFRPLGLDANALMPCYGMAESTLAVTFDRLSRPPTILAINRTEAELHRRAQRAAAGEPALEVVGCGSPFPEHALSIRCDHGKPVPDGHIGHIWLHGRSVTRGYFNHPEETAASICRGWLKTGDLGFILERQLFVTGRSKDLIIINGRNLAASDIEWEVESVPAIRQGHVVAFSVPAGVSEGLVIVAEAQKRVPLAHLHNQIRTRIYSAFSNPVHDIMVVKQGTLPKTSSGKIRRLETKHNYLNRTLSPLPSEPPAPGHA